MNSDLEILILERIRGLPHRELDGQRSHRCRRATAVAAQMSVWIIFRQTLDLVERVCIVNSNQVHGEMQSMMLPNRSVTCVHANQEGELRDMRIDHQDVLSIVHASVGEHTGREHVRLQHCPIVPSSDRRDQEATS